MPVRRTSKTHHTRVSRVVYVRGLRAPSSRVINALRSQFPFSITAPRRNPQCRAGGCHTEKQGVLSDYHTGCDPGETARLHACIARNKCSGSGNVITDVCVARNCRAEVSVRRLRVCVCVHSFVQWNHLAVTCRACLQQNPSLSFKLKEQSCRNVVNADTRRCPLLFDGTL